jgi:Bifunctional DNA primase/polymerase, N-terminal
VAEDVGNPTSAEILALRLQLLDNGWNVVPSSPSDKACYVRGWPSIQTNEFHLDNWAWSYPAHSNTAAVGNQNYFGVDIDVLSDPDLAHRVQVLAFEHLGPTPFIRVGLWPKRLLVYCKYLEVIQAYNGGRKAQVCVTPRPFVKSASFRAASGNGDGLEILSVGKQFTLYGMHNDAGRSYRWIGECNPLDDTPNDAPFATQAQVDAFLAAVEEIMPLVRAGSGRGGNGGDATRHVNADGRIDDGRESYLRDCVWQAAHEIVEQGEAYTAQAVADRGWELFTERAWNGDAKYNFDTAMQKAQLLLRRLDSGRVKLGGSTAAATPTFGIRIATGKRGKLWAKFCAQIDTAHREHRGICNLVAVDLIISSPSIGVPTLCRRKRHGRYNRATRVQARQVRVRNAKHGRPRQD